MVNFVPILKSVPVDGGGGTGSGEEGKPIISHRQTLHSRHNAIEVMVQPPPKARKKKIDHKQYLTKNVVKVIQDTKVNQTKEST